MICNVNDDFGHFWKTAQVILKYSLLATDGLKKLKMWLGTFCIKHFVNIIVNVHYTCVMSNKICFFY